MKLLVVLGSRNPEGQTARAAGALLQGALAWVWGRSERTIPTPGFKTVKQIEENIAAMDFGPLIAEQMKEIDVLLGC